MADAAEAAVGCFLNFHFGRLGELKKLKAVRKVTDLRDDTWLSPQTQRGHVGELHVVTAARHSYLTLYSLFFFFSKMLNVN